MQQKGERTKVILKVSLSNKIIGIPSFLPQISLFPFVWVCFSHQCSPMFPSSSSLFGPGIQRLFFCLYFLPSSFSLLHSHASSLLGFASQDLWFCSLQTCKSGVLPLKSLSSTKGRSTNITVPLQPREEDRPATGSTFWFSPFSVSSLSSFFFHIKHFANPRKAKKTLFIHDLQQQQGRVRGLLLQSSIGKPSLLSIAPGYSSLAPRLQVISCGQRPLFLQ